MKRVAKIVNSGYAHKRGYFGQNVTVAVVDSGIAVHRDFCKSLKYNNTIFNPEGRLVACVDTVNGRTSFYDDNGHGTHVAGIIGGYGTGFVGIAPACRFVSVKVLDKRGNGKLDNVLAGLQWILENKNVYNIKIVNISVGTGADKKCDEQSALVRKVDELWDAGLTVLAAAGNNGPQKGSIGAPGISRKIITVGAYDDNMKYRNNYSGRGPTPACIKKPDVVAPGSLISSCGFVNGGHFMGYLVKSGTSMATPVVSGAIAVLLSYNSKLSNKDIKILLKNTSRNLGYSHDKQGWGLIDISAMLRGTGKYEGNNQVYDRNFKK